MVLRLGGTRGRRVDLEGKSEFILGVPSFPFCIDWLPDGRLLIVSGGDGLLLRRERDGSLVAHADLTGLADTPWKDIVVDGTCAFGKVVWCCTRLAWIAPASLACSGARTTVRCS